MIESLLEIIARGGGGGSGGGGGGAGGIIIIPVLIGAFFVNRRRRRKRIQKAEHNQRLAVSTDDTWADQVIEKRVSEVFYKFQKDWSNFAVADMKSYMTPRYHNHIALMMAALKQMGRRNVMDNLVLNKVTLFGVHDHDDNEQDRFNVEVSASASDMLLDETTDRPLKSISEAFTEIWHFEKDQNIWMLDNITQINRDELLVSYDPVIDNKYVSFANDNGFFYNADFGWLLLPFHGVLFSHSRYGYSDINHHVIGAYRETVVQFFEYFPIIPDKASFWTNLRYLYRRSHSPLIRYTIAHTTLPKNYKNILVERRRGLSFFDFTPSGMHKISLEWSNFNKKFNVFASDIDKVSSLELLHPAFMAKLADMPFTVNMEVVENDLYLYTTDKNADYQTMLAILKEAFDEMKM